MPTRQGGRDPGESLLKEHSLKDERLSSVFPLKKNKEIITMKNAFKITVKIPRRKEPTDRNNKQDCPQGLYRIPRTLFRRGKRTDENSRGLSRKKVLGK